MAREAEIALAHDGLMEALAFYADPESYHAITFFPDPPCGEFMEDFGPHNHDFYDRDMPGVRARKALDAWLKLTDPARSAGGEATQTQGNHPGGENDSQLEES